MESESKCWSHWVSKIMKNNFPPLDHYQIHTEYREWELYLITKQYKRYWLISYHTKKACWSIQYQFHVLHIVRLHFSLHLSQKTYHLLQTFSSVQTPRHWQVKVLFAKPKDQSSSLRTHVVEGKDSSMLLHTPHACTHAHRPLLMFKSL